MGRKRDYLSSAEIAGVRERPVDLEHQAMVDRADAAREVLLTGADFLMALENATDLFDEKELQELKNRSAEEFDAAIPLLGDKLRRYSQAAENLGPVVSAEKQQ